MLNNKRKCSIHEIIAHKIPVVDVKGAVSPIFCVTLNSQKNIFASVESSK